MGHPNGSIIRVLTSSGTTAGVGVLLGAREAVTCAHVVNAALGRDLRSQPAPSGADIVEVSFPLLSSRHTPVKARVTGWHPPASSGVAGKDLAVLALTDAPPTGASPAPVETATPQAGTFVDVFGYPDVPPRPDGGWVEAVVRGTVDGGRLQLDGSAAAALRVQPGYSGSPVVDRATGRVVGLLVAAPRANTGERDSYAIPAARLADVRRAPATVARTAPLDELTVLHLAGLPADDEVAASLLGDIATRPVPDLIVVTGGLARQGRRSEFEHSFAFLARLAEAIGLPRSRVAVVPGTGDVNHQSCAAYFVQQEADERQPSPPFWPKWQHFAAAFAEFYNGEADAAFTPDEPWTLFEFPDLGTVVAGLNSTIAECHTAFNHDGVVGEEQLRWFRDRLRHYGADGWLDIAAVAHPTRRHGAYGRMLRDADAVRQLFARRPLLHGEPPPENLYPAPDTRLEFGASVRGTAADGGQYQLLTVRPDRVVRHLRLRDRDAPHWRDVAAAPPHVDELDAWLTGATRAFGVRPPQDSPPAGMPPSPAAHAGGVFFARVREATLAQYPDARIDARPESGYLRVSRRVLGGGVSQWPVGVIDGDPAESPVREYIERVHGQFAAADPQVWSDLVHSGEPAPDELVAEARRRGVRLRSFVDYQGIIDVRPLVRRQNERLATDGLYPAELYVPQRYRLLASGPDDVHDDLLGRVITWLDTDAARFVTLLGDFGRGKTFLLRQLARELPARLPTLLPVLIELRGLEKAPSLDELLAQHLVRQDVDIIDLAKIRYLVRSGRIALLFDGFDELALRVSYDHAADYLKTLIDAATEHAKIVLTSRTQHFQSSGQVLTALGGHVAALGVSRVALLEDFSEEQILRFLVNRYGGDTAAAAARFELLGHVKDLLGLSHNPRMLAFIAGLDDDRLREIQRAEGTISAAGLYRELIDYWLVGETTRQRYRGGLPSLEAAERRDACTALAMRLWESTATTIPMADLSQQVARTLTRLAERGYSVDQATHTVGSGTLLVQTDEGGFTFVHQSVMEWLVADAIATRLRAGEPIDALVSRRLSPLMTDFLRDLAGEELRRWSGRVLTSPATAETERVRQNAISVLGVDAAHQAGRDAYEAARDAASRSIGTRDGATPAGAPAQESAPLNLAGVDLRAEDLTGLNLRGADLRGADLRGMRLANFDLTGADLRDADFTGARLTRCDLTGVQLTGSRWRNAALLACTLDPSAIAAPELLPAAMPGSDAAEPVVATTDLADHLAASPDGALIAVTYGRRIMILDALTRSPLRTLTGHDASVSAVAFSADGGLLASAGTDGTVHIWDTITWRTRTKLGLSVRLTRPALAFSPDGAWLAIGCPTRLVLWRTSGPRTLRTLTALDPRSLTFAPDGATLMGIDSHGGMDTWDLPDGQHRKIVAPADANVTAVAFPSAGRRLIALVTPFPALLDALADEPETLSVQHDTSVEEAEFSPDGGVVALRSSDGTTRLVDTKSRATLAELPNGRPPRMTFTADGASLIATTGDGRLRWFDARTGQAGPTLSTSRTPVTDLAFLPNGSGLVTVSTDRRVRVWDAAIGVVRMELSTGYEAANGVAASPDGRYVATSTESGAVPIWDTVTGQLSGTIARAAHTAKTRVAFSPDGRRLATVSDITVSVWDVHTGDGIWARSETERIHDVAYSPDGQLLAVAANDGSLALWHVASNECALRVQNGGTTRAIAFSPDGQTIAAGSDDGTVRLWTVEERHEPRALQGHFGYVRDVAYSPGGQLIATGSDDGTARLWDVATGATRAVCRGHLGGVDAVAFSPGGRLLATGSRDGTARLWDLTGRHLATLVPLAGGGSAVLLPDGSYKIDGEAGDTLWWVVKSHRFAAGEVDGFDPAVRRLAPDVPIL